MKLADVDWAEVLDALPRWEALSSAARRAFLQVQPGTAAPPEALGAAADELVAAGFVTPPGPRGKLYPHAPELRTLLAALRAMERSRPLDAPGGSLPEAYVQEQLTIDETHGLAGEHGSYFWVDRRGTAALVSSADWVKDFLAAADDDGRAVAWERARQTRGEPPRLAVPHVAEVLRALVQALTAHPAGVPLRDLPALLPGASPARRAAALAAGLRYLLVFATLRGEEPDAVLGVLPCIVRRLGPPPPPPAPVTAAETFEAPFLVADMTAVLVEAAGEPIPVRGNDGGLYVRAQKLIAGRLLRLPPWTDEFTAVGSYDDEEDEDEAGAFVRISLASQALRLSELAKVASRGERYRFEATPAGRAWLALGEGERLKQVLDALRNSRQRNPGGWRAGEKTVDFFGLGLPFSVDEKTLDLRSALADAFLSLPAGMVPIHSFVRHQAETRNPFSGPQAAALRRRGWSGALRTPEGWESMWSQILLGFLQMRLLPLGCARLGRSAEGVAVGLTDAGRYLLGGVDDLHLETPPEGEIVVQPDFEIVFLSAAPRVEAELARLAERTGTGVGALFRITRASVLRAAEQGTTANAVLKTLAGASRAPVPENVSRQVRDWFASTRRVRIRPAVLVECPDAETAARVTGLGGGKVTAVTRTLLRLEGDAKFVAALAKKLRAKGIFVQE